ncbi:transient receptor potential Ca2 channel (TRP-CC) family protein [Achlya hypogyna]|uniref:Transient receptor potential Ca2 channel (TRP-CC) family protein n=1 Tax=Achlya hypogyna TaxID=1202772 RepID=A0A1V9YEX4_ACHHY|nr:transient receptor potential Ca2 channel (TRP-CC) family protein [Achlya hypogyna]
MTHASPTLDRRMSSQDGTHTEDTLPSPLTTHVMLPTGCHASFISITTPQSGGKRSLPMMPSPRSYSTTATDHRRTEDDVHFERTLQEHCRECERSLPQLVMPMVSRIATCIPHFAKYGNTFVSSRMISWTVRITVVHVFILVSIFIVSPHMKRKLYEHGTCDDSLDGITLTVYTGLANILLCLPAIHDDRYQLYNGESKKTWLLSFCELLVMVEIPYLVVKIAMHVNQCIENEGYKGCYYASNTPEDILPPWPWITWSIGLVVLDFYVYLACWYQIMLFNRMRDVALGQRNIIQSSHLFTFSNPDWLRFGARSKAIARIKRGLYDAAKNGHAPDLQLFLDEAVALDGPAFHVKWYTNNLFCLGQLAKSVRNPLHVAIVSGRLPIVRALLERGFDPNALDKIQTVSFRLSHIYTKIFNVLIFLRSTNFAQSSATTCRYGPNQPWSQVLLTPLHVAVIHSDPAIVELLLHYGADPNLNAVSNQRKYATPPLFYAECANCLRALMRAGANHLHIPGNGFFLTAYEVIVLNGYFSLANALVEWGGDIALTPMHLAAAQGDWRTVAHFLDAGVDPDILGENSSGRFHRTPLHWAAMRGQHRIVQLLLAHCKEDPCDTLGMTPLAWAAVYNHAAITDIYGRSLIHLLGHYETIEDQPRERVLYLLRDYGANIHAKTATTGETALHLALKQGNIQTARTLVQMGLDVAATDASGTRALDCAASTDIQYAIKKAAGQRDVMISYCHSHASFAHKLRASLEAHYITTWIDQMNPTGISGGSEWREEIARGILGASVVLAVLSEDYPQSQWCMKELAFAKQHNIPVVGVTCGRVVIGDELEVYLWTRQLVDFRPAITAKVRQGTTVRFEFDEAKYDGQIALLLDGLRDEIEERRVLTKAGNPRTSAASHASSRALSQHSAAAPTTAYVFLVHGDCHKPFATTLRSELLAAGVECKIDGPCPQRQVAAKDAILDPRCLAVVVVLSHLSTKSEALRDTLAFAENRAKPIIPIMLSLQTLDLALVYSLSRTAIHHFNESIGFRQSVERLLPHVRQLQLRRGASEVFVPTAPAPAVPAPASKLKRFLRRLNSQESELESVVDAVVNSPSESIRSHCSAI